MTHLCKIWIVVITRNRELVRHLPVRTFILETQGTLANDLTLTVGSCTGECQGAWSLDPAPPRFGSACARRPLGRTSFLKTTPMKRVGTRTDTLSSHCRGRIVHQNSPTYPFLFKTVQLDGVHIGRRRRQRLLQPISQAPRHKKLH